MPKNVSKQNKNILKEVKYKKKSIPDSRSRLLFVLINLKSYFLLKLDTYILTLFKILHYLSTFLKRKVKLKTLFPKTSRIYESIFKIPFKKKFYF